jgi:cell division protein FtsW
LLLAFGFVMVYSASLATAEAGKATGYRGSFFVMRHGLYLAIGIAAGFITLRVPMRMWQQFAPYLFICAALALAMVLIPGIGREVNGSRRWLSLGIVTMQPSEFMKLFCGLYAADYTVRKAAFMHSFKKGFLPMLAVMLFVGALLLREPDFGALVVITAVAMAILFLGGMNWRLFAGLIVLLGAGFVALIVSSPYRMQRVLGFMDPWSDPYGKGYQLSHALIAFGRGEWLGVGLGSAWKAVLPAGSAHRLLLAVVAEELGFVGVCTVIYCSRCWSRALSPPGCQPGRYFSALVAQGVGIWVAVQAMINMGVNMGVLPTKGLTLPLLSFGGSAIIANCLAITLLLRIDFENRHMMKGGAV